MPQPRPMRYLAGRGEDREQARQEGERGIRQAVRAWQPWEGCTRSDTSLALRQDRASWERGGRRCHTEGLFDHGQITQANTSSANVRHRSPTPSHVIENLCLLQILGPPERPEPMLTRLAGLMATLKFALLSVCVRCMCWGGPCPDPGGACEPLGEKTSCTGYGRAADATAARASVKRSLRPTEPGNQPAG